MIIVEDVDALSMQVRKIIYFSWFFWLDSLLQKVHI